MADIEGGKFSAINNDVLIDNKIVVPRRETASSIETVLRVKPK